MMMFESPFAKKVLIFWTSREPKYHQSGHLGDDVDIESLFIDHGFKT